MTTPTTTATAAAANSGHLVLIGGGLACYLAPIAITGTGNVPLNDDLAEVDAITSEAAADARADYEDDWNRLNLARTGAVVAGFALLAAAAASPTTTPASDGRESARTEVGAEL